eukprot:2621200-Ditylum_brightwellii.AAC.1
MPPCTSSTASHGTCDGTGCVRSPQEWPSKSSGIRAQVMMQTVSQNIIRQPITESKENIIFSRDSTYV